MQTEAAFEQVQAAVHERLTQNRRLRRNLPGGGRLRIDRQLPFLCVYRQPDDRDDLGTAQLATTEAAYLFTSGSEEYQAGLSQLCQSIAETVQEHFGVLLLLELWVAEDSSSPPNATLSRPGFEIVVPQDSAVPSTVDAFQQALQKVTVDGRSAEVRLTRRSMIAPPGMSSLTESWHRSLHRLGENGPETNAADTSSAETVAGCFHVGLAIRPIYRDSSGSGILYPVILQQLRRQLSRALRRAIFAFTGIKASRPSLHFDSIGPSTLVKATRMVDQQLCEVSESFDFLLQVTPVNAEQAWRAFADSDYQELPILQYRPLPYHPSLLKRRLFSVPVERIEDPTLAHLFWQKQTELDRQLTALRDLGSCDFVFGSLQLYGKPDAELIELARTILHTRWKTDPCEESDDPTPLCVSAEQMAAQARDEIDYYHGRQASFHARVEVCDHIASGLMVTGDRLYVSETFHATPGRAESLLHHEVGTHLLTYFNGREQPFRQLYAGLAGYDGLQEGLAMLAEYCTGGLTPARMRTIAARVLAVSGMLGELPFAETFRQLRQEYGLTARSAFISTLRAYRGGGLTKDIIYLRGLREILKYLADGHDLEPLFVGKIALDHVPFIQELRRRGIIKAPALLPRYWEFPCFRARLEECRTASVLDLVKTSFLPQTELQKEVV